MIAEALARWFAVLTADDHDAARSDRAIRIGVGSGTDHRQQALQAAGAPPPTAAVDGRPTFGDGVTGSITHCGDVTVAVVDLGGRPLGVDLELLVGADLDASVLLAHHERVEQPLRVVLAAKEAAGKTIAGFTGAWLDPRAIVLSWDGDAFSAEPPHGRTEWSGLVRGGVSMIDGDRVVAAAISRRRGSGPGRS